MYNLPREPLCAGSLYGEKSGWRAHKRTPALPVLRSCRHIVISRSRVIRFVARCYLAIRSTVVGGWLFECGEGGRW